MSRRDDLRSAGSEGHGGLVNGRRTPLRAARSPVPFILRLHHSLDLRGMVIGEKTPLFAENGCYHTH